MSEFVTWIKITVSPLMSKPSSSGTLEFDETVTQGYKHAAEVNAKFYAEVSGETGELAALAAGKISGKAGVELSGQYGFDYSQSTQVHKRFVMPPGSPGFVYQCMVEARTNKGRSLSWSGGVMMTDSAINFSEEKHLHTANGASVESLLRKWQVKQEQFRGWFEQYHEDWDKYGETECGKIVDLLSRVQGDTGIVNFISEAEHARHSFDLWSARWGHKRDAYGLEIWTEALSDAKAVKIPRRQSTGTQPKGARSELHQGASLGPGEELRSPNGRYSLRFQHDTNIVVYKDGEALWHSATYQKATPGRLTMQSDGNLVAYDPSNNDFWKSDTWHQGEGPYRLVMQDDGNLVLYDSHRTPTWSSKTWQG